MKRKSMPEPKIDQQTLKKAKFALSPPRNSNPEITEKEFSELTDKINVAYKKYTKETVGTSTNKELLGEILVLMKETVTNRRRAIERMITNGSVKAVLDLFPFYEDPLFVSDHPF